MAGTKGGSCYRNGTSVGYKEKTTIHIASLIAPIVTWRSPDILDIIKFSSERRFQDIIGVGNGQGEIPLYYLDSKRSLLNSFFQSFIVFTSDINNETKIVFIFVLRDSILEERVKLRLEDYW